MRVKFIGLLLILVMSFSAVCTFTGCSTSDSTPILAFGRIMPEEDDEDYDEEYEEYEEGEYEEGEYEEGEYEESEEAGETEE